MKRIGVFDSGIGGLTVLEELKIVLPNEDYLFYADSKNCPYGEKSDTELYDITSNIVDYLIDRECKIIVIACNTATTRCIKYLRDKYKDKEIDAIVLGCTHYPHIKDLISKYFTNAELLDGGAGVARETKRQLERMNMLGTGLSPVVEIVNSLDM